MKLEELARGLASENTQTRMKLARVIGTLEEVALLPQMTEAYHKEANAEAKAIIVWAGKRLRQASNDGFNTLDALMEHFGINRAIRNITTEDENFILRAMQDRIEREEHQKRATGAIATNLSNAALGTTPLEGNVFDWRDMDGWDTLPDRLKSLLLSMEYQKPIAPSQAEIAASVKALRAPDRLTREDAITELFRLKNLKAIPHLAALVYTEKDEVLREHAQNTAKMLYWNSVSWEMYADGRMAQEIERRARELGKYRAEDELPATDSVKPRDTGPLEDINVILARAQAEREKRRRRR